jgi:hypothetical protein
MIAILVTKGIRSTMSLEWNVAICLTKYYFTTTLIQSGQNQYAGLLLSYMYC